ncbi:hypothetical protein HBH98_130720 [Parastagonospora nodorum]|nr:hypothetical protein HBI09_076560 [Parastagonospora nodorum]KAH4068265.1 hypothetical protein HBH50_124690 [Parastagonospora nodorum]KAH4085499.1 hypothetical protein HBH48_150460 [Parastagonospora nodorum]KAH4251143.1 hypothetical protein HBI03_230040 [Parastagonospora nodorum]KAH4275949.1 hypothetical protein HBI04_115920 [Parastagonospora nodorum]
MIARSRIYRQITTRTVSHCSAKSCTYPTSAYHDTNVHSRQFSSGGNHGANAPGYCAPHFSNMNFDMVLVRVGKPADAVDIMVYRHLICSVSTFFRGAIDRSFLGVKEGTITLRDVSEATFRTFLAWLHSQYLPPSPPEPLLGYLNGLKVVTNTAGDAVNSEAKPAGRGRPRKRMFDEYVSGKSPVLRILGPEELDRHFHSNPAWQNTYQEVVKALVRLYIFADRYSIPQLRDDVMSTYVGYCISFGLYPDPDDIEVIDLAYTKLPATAMLSRYLVLSTIYFWTPVKPTLESGKLKKLHPGFTLDVMTAQAQRGQPPEEGETDATKTVPQLAKHGLKNSCVFHEHQVFDEDTCRHRLANSKFIFDGILDACMKEAKTVVGKAS